MSSKLAISLVIGASVGGAIAGIKSLKNEFKIFNDQTQSVGGRIKSLGMNSLKSIATLSSMATGVTTSLMSMAQPAIKFESAMADVRKVVDFKTPEGFKSLSKDILELTRTIPMSAEELAAITASGGQLGVAEQDLKAFTTTIAKMSVAFDMSAEDSGDAMAKLANVYKIPIGKIGDLGDAINELSNSSPAKAADIVNTLGRVGGVAKQFGLTENAAAALSNSFISLGKAPEVAGTAINGMLTKLMTAEKGGKKFQAALKSMGLNAKGLKQAIGKDAEGALKDFLKQVNKLPKEKQMGALVDLFGLEYADDVALLAGNVDVLDKSLKTLQETDENGKPKYLGSMEKEFAARSATTEANLQTLKNSFVEIGISLGSSLLPPINKIVNAIKPLINQIADWIAKNPVMIEYALSFGGALLGLVGSVFALKSALGIALAGFLPFWQGGLKVVKTFKLLRVIIGAIGFGPFAKIIMLSALPSLDNLITTLKSLTTVIGHVGRAFLANHIGIAVALIAGLAYLLWDNWDWVSTKFTELWQTVSDTFSAAWNSITSFCSEAWTNISNFFTSGIGNITATILNWSLLGLFQQVFAEVLSWFGIEVPSKFSDFGKNMIDGLVNGIKNAWEGAKEMVASLGEGIKGWFAEKLGIHSPSRVFKGYGVNVVEGLTIGMANSIPMAETASDNLASAVSLNGAPQNAGLLVNYQPLSRIEVAQVPTTQTQGVTVNFNPTINVNGGAGQDVVSQVSHGLQISMHEFETLLNRVLDQRQRRAY